MAEVYASLIQKGLKTIDDIPPKLKKQVEKILAERAKEAEAETDSE